MLGVMEIESLQGHDMWIVGKGAIASYRRRRLESREEPSTTVGIELKLSRGWGLMGVGTYSEGRYGHHGGGDFEIWRLSW